MTRLDRKRRLRVGDRVPVHTDEEPSDAINPQHYKSGGLEAIDVMAPKWLICLRASRSLPMILNGGSCW